MTPFHVVDAGKAHGNPRPNQTPEGAHAAYPIYRSFLPPRGCSYRRRRGASTRRPRQLPSRQAVGEAPPGRPGAGTGFACHPPGLTPQTPHLPAEPTQTRNGDVSMPRYASLGLFAAVLVGVVFVGCGRHEPRPTADPVADNGKAPSSPTLPGEAKGRPAADAPAGPQVDVSAKPALDLPLIAPPDLGAQEKYDAALLDALNLLADGKLTEALAALEAARAIQDTEQVRLEIDKLKKRLEEQAAAERTVEDIQTVLTEGKPEEAARLAADALQQYGGSEAAAQLARLKRQADALAAAQLNDNAARRARFRQEGEAALREKNLRAAAIAFEQTLQYGDDADLRRQYDDLRASLARYDENRQRAAELRRDAANLEDALAALQEAAGAW